MIELTYLDLMILSFSALLSGMSKSGLSGVSLISVAIFSQYFSKNAVGVLLPLLIVADFTVYPNFKKYGSWKPVWKLLPPIGLGLVAGFWMLNQMEAQQAKTFTGVLILIFLSFMLMKQYASKWHEAIVNSPWMTGGSGLLVGIATSMANAAGPVSQIYLRSQSFTKNETVGIAGRLFLLVNLIKVPINWSFEFITTESFFLNLKLMPFVILGVFLGKWVLKWVPEALFSKIIYLSCFLSACKLMIPS